MIPAKPPSERYEELDGWAKELAQSGKLVIVEGQKDEFALNTIGIDKIYALSQKPLYLAIEEIARICDEAVILTDLDAEGKKIFGELNKGLQSYGVEVDNHYREFLHKNTPVKQIEGIAKFKEKLGLKRGYRYQG